MRMQPQKKIIRGGVRVIKSGHDVIICVLHAGHWIRAMRYAVKLDDVPHDHACGGVFKYMSQRLETEVTHVRHRLGEVTYHGSV